jgi:transposase
MAEQATALEPQPRQGRPTLCDTAIADKIVAAVATGAYWKPACIAAGIDYSTVRDWIAKADRDRAAGVASVYTEFTNRLKRAEADAELALGRMVAATPDDWRAQAFVLERRYRERWGKSDAPSVAGQVVVSDALASQLADAMRVAAPQLPAIEVSAEPSSTEPADD